MRIGQLAKSASVGVETVRYYQRLGLLTPPDKPHTGFRSYSKDDLARLKFVRRAQRLGFSLDDIAGLIELSNADCADVQVLARHKLDLVRQKLADLHRIADVLDGVLRQCTARGSHQGCPIIESLRTGDGA